MTASPIVTPRSPEADAKLRSGCHSQRAALTEFRARSLGPAEVSFENPAHDFPQRIRYRLAAADWLIASIEGDREGRRQPIAFSYRRVACGEPSQ